MVRSSSTLTQAAVLCLFASSTQAFSGTSLPSKLSSKTSSTRLYDGNGTGGWGIGGSREMVPEEFARGDRSYFDGYQMRDQGDFRRQLQQDQQSLRKSEMDELLGVAEIAGLKVKNPKDRLNKFEKGLLADDDDDELDLSI